MNKSPLRRSDVVLSKKEIRLNALTAKLSLTLLENIGEAHNNESTGPLVKTTPALLLSSHPPHWLL